ncbi:Uncharacterised protein [Vibrio cholerae]|nr:Uncharacterised protein [Vibrio cholerae]
MCATWSIPLGLEGRGRKYALQAPPALAVSALASRR